MDSISLPPPVSFSHTLPKYVCSYCSIFCPSLYFSLLYFLIACVFLVFRTYSSSLACIQYTLFTQLIFIYILIVSKFSIVVSFLSLIYFFLFLISNSSLSSPLFLHSFPILPYLHLSFSIPFFLPAFPLP